MIIYNICSNIIIYYNSMMIYMTIMVVIIYIKKKGKIDRLRTRVKKPDVCLKKSMAAFQENGR
jgi:hypothetical protein